MEEIKLTEKEIKLLVDLRHDVSQLYVQIGQFYLQKKDTLNELDKREEKLLSESRELKERETIIYNEIGDKYGHGNINLETGVFTPINEN